MANIGLCFVNPAPLTKPENVVNFAKKCEAMGRHSMWTIDRIAYDNLEPLTVLAAAAGATQKIRLGTSVLLPICAIRPLLAKIVATLDFISNGRVTVGLGFGSRENDYKPSKIPFEARGSRAVEHVQLMKRLWTEENVTHKGRFYNVRESDASARGRFRNRSPILTGGSAEVALKRAGTWANGFICGSSAIPGIPHHLGENRPAMREQPAANPNEIKKAGLTFMAIDDDQSQSRETVEQLRDALLRSPSRGCCKHVPGGLAPRAVADRIGAFLSRGLDTLIIGLADPDPRQLDLFGEKVLPKVK